MLGIKDNNHKIPHTQMESEGGKVGRIGAHESAMDDRNQKWAEALE